MIKFFRKIRQKLLEQNRISKYLLYAFGEIILVVIGILIALQINNWNENKKDSKQEQEILHQLLNEYNNNLEQLNSKIYIRQQVLKSAFEILKYQKMDLSSIKQNDFDLHLSRVITRPTFDPVTGVSDELNSSGKLYLIKNAALRTEITSFKSHLGELREEEMVTFNHVENLVIPFLIEKYSTGNVISEFLKDDDFISSFTLSTSKEDFPIEILKSSHDFYPLLQSKEFKNHLSLMISNVLYQNQQSYGVKETMENTIKMIKSQLKND